MQATQRRRYRRALHALRLECPTLLPVRVVLRREPAPVRLCGWSSVVGEKRGFRVVICLRVFERGAKRPRPLHMSEIIEVLMHEWAHCLAWHSGHSDLQDHPPGWGVAYAECYRAVIED